MTSRIVGTTAYMAPEALRGEITPKSDIYSFGVVSFICMYLCIHVIGFPGGASGKEPACQCRRYEIWV